MRNALSDRAMAELIVGSWRIAGTNLPLWSSGRRLQPRIRYEPAGEHPLQLHETVSFLDADGADHEIDGTDRYRDGVFTRRGCGLLRLARSIWWMTNADSSGSVLVIRRAGERRTAAPTPPGGRPRRGRGAGIDVLERADAAVDARAVVAANASAFDLGPEEFATLDWLAEGPSAS
ncbi:hypothetical protein QT381_02035 [Galbitalea sp. SE-J8]|uniref:hypothetical protein n=1 Tax=Galbitalea sp. SE-J8 TaxID=3054952 RepID=UPI00259D0A0D|nr:hypothetical protein [Galbitalea sp. SE-J8]MDM4761783.1 hypothetical protein [Galbitalea sp. SE-J8]